MALGDGPLSSLLLLCRTLRRARRELRWAQSSCRLSRHQQPCRDKLLGLWLLPENQALPSVLLQLQRPYSCSVVSSFFEDGCNRAALKCSLSCKWWVWTCLLKKLWVVLERIMGPSASLGLRWPYEDSALHVPSCKHLPRGSPGEEHVPELPRSGCMCLKEGVTALVLWRVIAGSPITRMYNATTEVN